MQKTFPAPPLFLAENDNNMNVRLFLFSFLAGITLILTGCDRHDDDHEGIIPLPPVAKAFQEKYPNARDAFFDIDGSYYVVDFKNNNVSTTAWFTDQGVWTMDKASVPFSQLPTDVIGAFNQSAYSKWAIDDSYVINLIDMAAIYKIEVEYGDNEADLYYSGSGKLIKTVDDNTNNDSLTNFPKDITAL